MDKGANWRAELTDALADARAGIICLTPSNLGAPWLLFEAGAIAKTVEKKPLACTLLIGLKSSDVPAGPLTLFQDTKLTQDDVLRLVKTLNKALDKDALSDAQVEKSFESFWPQLEKKFNNLPSDDVTDRPQRSEREMIEEILDTVRTEDNAVLLNWIAKGIQEISAKLPNTIGVNYSFQGLEGLTHLQSLVSPQPPPLVPSKNIFSRPEASTTDDTPALDQSMYGLGPDESVSTKHAKVRRGGPKSGSMS
jgi:hypothetical protein